MRINKASFFKLVHFIAVILFPMALLLTGCNINRQEATVQPTITVDATLFPPTLITATSTEIPATATATLLPPPQEQKFGSEAGLIIFSMGDGEYKHLFAYHPSFLPITRLTSDAWDDDSPVISPDGNQLVFTSNRFGPWDIFLWDLPGNSLKQLTKTNDFEGSLSWSPDGQWITYDVYQATRYSIMIQSATDLTAAPIQLTDATSNSFAPAWSPSRREIAFVTDRSGRNEIWLARLDDPANRFSKIIGSTDADYSDPAWSMDGKTLAWTRTQTNSEVQMVQPFDPKLHPVTLGIGRSPIWLPDGSGVLALLDLPNQNEFIAYSAADQHLLLPPLPVSGIVSSYDWKDGQVFQNVQMYLSSTSIPLPDKLWADEQPVTSNETGRLGLDHLVEGVEAPQPYLSNAADESFKQLRTIVAKKLGWDLLSILENASLSISTPPIPGLTQNWLYTGRAIALNMAPFEAGWITVTREEYNGETYWRVWVKCQKQDGTCGLPQTKPAWDFVARYSGDIAAYEKGGKVSSIPEGYWLDFTELAFRFGWERLASQSNWRSYFPEILFNTFVYRQNLSWQEAMLQLYPSDAVDLLMEKQK